jgi:uncharacterized phosphatase
MTGTVLGLFRHGQTDWNIDLRLQGTADIPMNATGIDQVRRAAEKIDPADWDLLLTSPLGRARQTAEILAESLGLGEPAVEPLLLERNFGLGEGLTYAQWQENYSKLDEIPGAEPEAKVIERARLLLETFQSAHSTKRVLAVSHGALIRFVLSTVTDGAIPPKGERLQNASLHLLDHAESWTLRAWAPAPLGSE